MPLRINKRRLYIRRVDNRLFLEILVILLLTQFIVIPKIMMPLKAAFLLLILIISFWKRGGRISVNDQSVILLMYIIYNIISILIGVLKGNGIAALRSGTVGVLWPIFFFCFMGADIDTEWLALLYRVFIWITFFICILDTLLIISGIFHIESIKDVLSFMNRNKVAGGNSNGLFIFRSDHIYFYAFLTPFMMSVFLGQKKKEYRQLKVSPVFVKSVCIFTMLISVLSGMGGVWLAQAVGFIICIYKYKIRKGKWLLFLLAGMVVGVVFLISSYHARGIAYPIIEEVADHLFLKSRGYDDTRGNQIKAMVNVWMSNPCFGVGSGGTVGYIRGGVYTVSSAGESSYFVLLYQKGLIGMALFFGIVAAGIRSLKCRMDASWYCHPFIVGMICFLIANAFNPYLANMSTIWILLFPLLVGGTRHRL